MVHRERETVTNVTNVHNVHNVHHVHIHEKEEEINGRDNKTCQHLKHVYFQLECYRA